MRSAAIVAVLLVAACGTDAPPAPDAALPLCADVPGCEDVALCTTDGVCTCIRPGEPPVTCAAAREDAPR